MRNASFFVCRSELTDAGFVCRREVPHDEAAAYAKQNGLFFIETSARTACNVKEVRLPQCVG